MLGVHGRMKQVMVGTVATADPEGPATAMPEFEQFFLEHHRALHRALWLLTRNRFEAEEVMQDAFLKLWERWPRMGGVTDPVAYLYRTAMNLYRSRLRRARVAMRKAVRHVPADDAMAVVESRDAVVRALATLPANQRAAIVLTDVLDLTSEEAATVLRSKPVTVRVRASRGREALRREMEERNV
jgi:RNA polymerase sigma-70 factor (ECF subfamily)